MKIRKLKIKNYKLFEDIEFDFTDKNGNTLNTIIFAGINGTGKTTLLELIAKILLPEFESTNDICIEIEFSEKEISYLTNVDNDGGLNFLNYQILEIQELHKKKYFSDYSTVFKARKFSFKNTGSTSVSNSLPLLKIIANYLKSQKEFEIAFFNNNIFPKRTEETTTTNTSNILKYINYVNYENDIEKHFDNVIYNYLKKHRNLTFDEITKKRILEINILLKGLEVNTKIIDIIDNKLVLENVSGKRLEIRDLSDGEKQIYLRAVFLNSLNLNDSIILTDEPETSLHPRWQSSIISLYEKAGNNNQIFIATHSPHIIGKAEPESIFLLNFENKKIIVEQPKYTKGHSIPYVLSEIMETDYYDTHINEIVNNFLELIRQGKHETEKGKKILKEINKLSPESEERIRVKFSLERYKAIGR